MRRGYRSYEGREPSFRDLCAHLPTWPHDPAGPGHAPHPVLGLALVGRLVEALEARRRAFVRMLLIQDAQASRMHLADP